ncbi:MAG: hypothetical protein QXR65_08080 [Candidatus Bathyarchaeia archaeon]
MTLIDPGREKGDIKVRVEVEGMDGRGVGISPIVEAWGSMGS